MKLLVGLGNPGSKYQGTRHNVGFAVLAELSRKYGAGKPKRNFDGEVIDADLNGQRALLLWPLTFMNRSGASVAKAVDFFKLSPADWIVICDDFNLPLSKLRFRVQGSSGGQKGLQDIIQRLGTEEFSRLRIGIGQPPPGWDPADYVLGKFGKQELADIEVAVGQAADALEDWAGQGIEYCMNHYN